MGSARKDWMLARGMGEGDLCLMDAAKTLKTFEKQTGVRGHSAERQKGDRPLCVSTE